jgi:tRNA dimethylallyltransferase
MNSLEFDTPGSKLKTVYVIAGPTAVGKTVIAIDLAKRLQTDIVSADSRQCYRGMTIGTAKPTAAELAAVKHYFIDEFPATQNITAADYEQLSLQYVSKIFETHQTTVVCGGTGLYIKALTEGLDEMPAVNPSIEKEVNQLYQTKGLLWLQETIQEEDPYFFAQAEQQNPARLLRALIFKRSTQKSITEFRTGIQKERPFGVVKIALNLPRELLYERINKRVNMMIEEGLVEEVKGLQLFKSQKNLQTVGYAELFDFFEGKYSLDEAVEKIKQHTRNYAKRQLTWFRKDKDYHWLEANDPLIVEKILALKP